MAARGAVACRHLHRVAVTVAHGNRIRIPRERRAIDGSERLYLHVIFNHRHARLYDLEVRSFGSLGESKAIASHHHSVLQDHAIAHAAVFAHHGMRMSTKIVADLRALVDHRMRVENSISAN